MPGSGLCGSTQRTSPACLVFSGRLAQRNFAAFAGSGVAGIDGQRLVELFDAGRELALPQVQLSEFVANLASRGNCFSTISKFSIASSYFPARASARARL